MFKKFRSTLGRKRSPLRKLGLIVLATILLGCGLFKWQETRRANAVAAQAVKAKRLPNLDIRVTDKAALAEYVRTRQSVVAAQVRSQAQAVAQGLTQLRARVPSAEAKLSPLTGAVETLRSAQALSGPAPGRSGADIVNGFLKENSGLYGLSADDLNKLHVIGESTSQGSGLRMVRVEQTVNGRPVFQSETRFVLNREGRLVRSTGLFIPQASAMATALNRASLLSATQALQRALATVGITADTTNMRLEKTSTDGWETEVVVNHQNVGGNVVSRLVYFPVAPGVLVPAWSQVTFTDGPGDWYTLVDATTGTLLWRKNIRANVSVHDARFRVYVQADGTTPADNPAPLSPTNATPGSNTQPPGIAPTIVSMHTAMALFGNVSQNGWIDDCPGGVCTNAQTQTIGNNVHAYMDRVGGAGAGGANQPDTAASSVIDGEGKPTGNPDTNGRNRDFLGTTPRDFETNYLPPPQGGNAEAGQTPTGNGNNGTLPVDQFRRGMLTQLFYVTNWYHDRMFQLGFDEAAGNFQLTNFSGMGFGNDRVLAEGQDSSGTDNANFSTPPDGQSGRAQMFRFIGPTVDRDGSLDTEVLIHELTHGTSNRLIGNAAGLIWDPGVGMGEGWSDFYALSLLNNTNADDPNGSYASGGYATYKAFGVVTYTDNYLYGIRRFPYSTNNTVNPLTWADVDDYTNNLSGGIAADPLGFNIGGAQEVHNTGEIWALTLWEVRSRIIAANAGDVPTGNQIMLQIVTDAMKLTPVNPSYEDARDALIDADCASNACANEQAIWDGFADRGLGYGARSSTVYGFAPVATHQGIVESFLTPYLDQTTVAVDDTLGNNNGAIDPGEPIRITVTLTNPWRNASKNVASATATLATATAGVTIVDGNSTYPAIAAQGSAAGDTFQFNVPLAAACGQSLNFTVTTTSSLGTQAIPLSFRVGAPSGTGAPVTYTRTPGGPLTIQDNRPRGVIDSQTITDDLEIADINVRIDSLPHTFPGDVTFGVKAPNGYGVDLVTFIGGAVAGGGDGDNITNMVIDNQAVGDILLATNAQAPYTGSWLPIANSPSWPILGFGPQEPVGELNKLNGASTLGTWQVLASDQAAVDTGTLNGWSLIVTPRAFACTPFISLTPPNVTGIKTVAGTFQVGGTVTYTVVLSNSGTAAQQDNAGDEFTDVLPAGLTLVSANATSGTAVANVGTNTVTWNGAIAGAGSVTITITATVHPNAANTTVLNQGAISFDANNDTTNDTIALTDDPGTAAPNDPTGFFVPCPTIVLSPSSLPNATVNAAYGQVISAMPIGGGYTFAVTSGLLPTGLTLNANGSFSGAPTQSGTFNFRITATGFGGGCTGFRDYVLVVVCPIVTLPPTLPGGVQGTAYSQSVAVSPATPGYTYAVTTNVLPPGLSLDATTGAITGTPSAAGNYTFVVTATGGGGCTKSQSYNLLITGTCTTITVNPTTLPNGTLGTAYPLTTVSATGGVAPYAFAVTQGVLPAGLALNGTTGEITGTPTAAGTLSFRITATGQGGCTGSRVYVVSVACATLTFNPTSLPNGAKGVAYNQAITVTPGTGHTFSVLLGSLPPGFTLSAAGLLSGLTNQAGTWTFTVKAVLGSCQATKQYTLTIPNSLAPTALAQLNDYDGDAKSDLALFAANGEWRIQRSSDQKSQTVLWGTTGDLPVSGDYDGDGKTDIAVFRPSNGTWYVKRSSDGGALVKAWGLGTDVPVPGDYDGDGQTDIAIWRGGEGNWYILRSSDQQFEMANWGLGLAPFSDVPVAGDYDGDGKTDLGVFRRASGVWYVRQSGNGSMLVKQWGVGTDMPVVQDYDGDAKVDLAVWRGATGLWYIQASTTGATRATAWGAGFAPYNDQAVPGDYDGDGQSDLAVWRAADATWYVLQSNNGSMLTRTQGQSGDAPVVQRMR
jgi:uncharacterized repeat protein (TIGR01451 family)